MRLQEDKLEVPRLEVGAREDWHPGKPPLLDGKVVARRNNARSAREVISYLHVFEV